jgi:transglutaminase-like putative cysteine protease
MKIRSVLVIIASIFVFLLFPGKAQAQNEFITDADVTYKVLETGRTEVTHQITLENAFSTLYAPSQTITLENIEISELKAYGENGTSYHTEVTKEGDKTKIQVYFPDFVVGKGKKRVYSVIYENGSYATRTGEVWEISIPSSSSQSTYRSYNITLKVPDNFGLEAYISPRAVESGSDDYGKYYKFSKDEVSATGITAGFGQFQVFSFNLNYHLENPLATSAETQISLPPDTAFQKVYLGKITPKPENVLIDEDGNWLATYKLSPRQRIDVMVTGSVQIFASYRKFPKPTEANLSKNLKESEYWQVDDPEIKALAANLKTPEAIYKYVSETLKYDYDRVQPNVQRMGAKKALESPLQAICMEFTDLFIAISRAAGIPAREVNGYAYTENPVLQPLSLVADVLHAWPEYYDKEKGVWIPVDPTWAATSGGVDYFNKLDLRHFSFVIHGESAVKPYPPGSYKLGANPQKDVFVSFGKLPEDRFTVPVVSLAGKRPTILLDSVYRIKIENPGPAALYSLYTNVYFDDREESRNFIEMLPPHSSYEMDVKVPFSLLGKDTPDKVRVTAESSHIEIPTNKSQVIVNSLITIFAVFFAVLTGILLKLKKISFAPLLDFISRNFKMKF